MFALQRLLSPSFAVALAALVVALGGTAIAAGGITGSDAPETVLKMRVTKDGKLIGTHNDGTVKKAGVGIYDITFKTGPTGSKVPLKLDRVHHLRHAARGKPRRSRRRSPPTSTCSAWAGADLRRVDGWCRSARTKPRRS